jgi:hypothetical protein
VKTLKHFDSLRARIGRAVEAGLFVVTTVVMSADLVVVFVRLAQGAA